VIILSAEVRNGENEIDGMLYTLYGLTEEKVKILDSVFACENKRITIKK